MRIRTELVIAFAAILGNAAEFRASVVKIDITPKTPKWLMGYAARQSTGVLDPIYHRILVLDDGATRFALVSTDVCVFSPTLYDQLAATVEKQTGISKVNFWWTATHTHSAPEIGSRGMYDILLRGRSEHPVDDEYTNELTGRIVEGLKQAISKLEPARISIGTGTSNANINRRARDVDGTISLGLNPDGPVDRQIGLLRIERVSNERPLALVANYAMHGTVLGGRWMQISGDAQGTVAEYVEKRIGAPMLYINGAAGNLAPIYTTQDNPRAGHLTEFNVLLGDKIVAASRALGTPTAKVNLRSAEKIIETTRRFDIGWNGELGPYSSEDKTTGAPLVKLPLRFLRVNDTLIWGGPVEMFCELALEIRKWSPFANTFFFGYTNGWLGYLPTRIAFVEGGYEPRTSPFTPEVERDVVKGVAAFLKTLR
jgi:neutral ceramidase